jgi:hypothetical protein
MIVKHSALVGELQPRPMPDSESFADLVDHQLHDRSGAVFYSGPAAFAAPARLYLLGLNPGGSPTMQAGETIGRDLAEWRAGPQRWSAYVDASWRGMPAGTYGIQPRIRHLFDRLGLDPCDIPASNVVFLRSNDEAALAAEKHSLLTKCWPVHQAVINALGVSTVLCLGGTAGQWVRSLLGAKERAGRFVESNSRGWTSEAHVSGGGMCVITLTHPGRADWRNPAADPTPLVREMLAR